MRDPEFIDWLLSDLEISRKAAKDAASRCRRIERDFGIDLDQSVRSQASWDKLLDRMAGRKLRQYVFYAARLYARFGNPKLELRLYAYRGKNTGAER